MVHGFDIKAIIKSTIKKIFNIKLLLIIVCIDFKLLYNCLIKLSSIQKKRFIIDLIYLQQLYKQWKIMEIR